MESIEGRRDGFSRAFFIGFGAGCLLFVVYMISLVLLGELGLGTEEPLVSPDATELDSPPPPPAGYGGPGTTRPHLRQPAATRPPQDQAAPRAATPAQPQPKPETNKQAQTEPAPVDTPRSRAEGSYNQGLEHLRARRYKKAQALLNEALGADGKFAPAWRDLGLVYEKLGNKDMAQAAFSRYLFLSPDAPDADLVRQRIKNL